MQITGSEAIVKCLEKAGVEYVFGLCGHANLSMLDALSQSNIKFISVRDEQNAAHMADAYYRFSHRPGVVLTTIGPGLAKAAVGVWEAAMDCSGVVVISGNVPSYMIGRDAFQELTSYQDASQAEVFRPFVKRTWRIADHSLIPHVMHRAFNFALAGRPGPVVVDVPMDYMSKVAEFDIPDIDRHRPTGMRVRGDLEEIRRAAALLVAAENPLIHAGNGALLSQAREPIMALAEYLGIPVTTSLLAQGLVDKLHPLSGGYPGVVGTPTGNHLAREADVVLALGTRFSELETSSWDPEYSFKFARGSKLIQVDIDPHEIGKAYPVEVGIVGDISAVVTDMASAVQRQTPRREWKDRPQIQELHRISEEWAEEKERISQSDQMPVLNERVLREMQAVLPESAIILADAGTVRHGVGQYYPLREPQTWFVPSGLGTMGGAAPAALGAKFAHADRPVVCLIGDGGFSANDSAMATAVEAGVSVIWIVLNNHAYDSIRAYQHIHYDDRVYGTDFRRPEGGEWNPDFVKVAEGYGVAGTRVDSPVDIGPALKTALAAKAPYLIEIVVAPTRLKATGHWDVSDLLAQEAAFKRARNHDPQRESNGNG